MSQAPFLGVELPDKFETNSSESAPEVSEPSRGTDNAPEENKETPDKPESEAVDKQSAPADGKPDLFDLDKHERVRFKGKEWSVKELHDSYLRHEDYTRKVQLANEERKYAQNFDADLDAVIAGRATMADFKKIYPQRYVSWAEKALERVSSQGPATETKEAQAFEAKVPAHIPLDPETQSKLDRLIEFQNSVQQRVEEAQEKEAGAAIDAWTEEFSKKYPSANQRLAIYDAGELVRMKEESTGKPVSKEEVRTLFEKVFKDDHEAREKWFAERNRTLINEQKAAARRGQDMGSGGGVPTAPSKKPKTFNDARALMEADIEAGRLS